MRKILLAIPLVLGSLGLSGCAMKNSSLVKNDLPSHRAVADSSRVAKPASFAQPAEPLPVNMTRYSSEELQASRSLASAGRGRSTGRSNCST